MPCDRRAFVQQSLGLAAALMVGEGASEAGPHARSAGSGDLLARMVGMNEPESDKHDGDRLVVRSGAKTDFWRKTFYGYITDNGHFFDLAASRDFTFQARVNG